MDALQTLVNERDFFRVLESHVTRTIYDESRATLLQLISRKIAYKERLSKQFESEFTDELHKRFTAAENEVNSLLAFVQSFDKMAQFMANETAKAVDENYRANRQNMILTQLLDAEMERAESWSNTAFKLSGDYIKRSLNPSQFAQ